MVSWPVNGKCCAIKMKHVKLYPMFVGQWKLFIAPVKPKLLNWYISSIRILKIEYSLRSIKKWMRLSSCALRCGAKITLGIDYVREVKHFTCFVYVCCMYEILGAEYLSFMLLFIRTKWLIVTVVSATKLW